MGPPPDGSREAIWLALLEGRDPRLRRFRRFYKLLPSPPRCKFCNAPFHGPAARVLRLVHKEPWAKNPTFCRDCFGRLQTLYGGAEIELTLLFADVRGSTGLGEALSPTEFGAILNRFYAVATERLIAEDAVVDKFAGDEVMALFIPGFAGADHARRAIEAGRAILADLAHAEGESPALPVGIGIHTGRAFVGAVGAEGSVTDFTALGDPVNSAARLSSEAGPGELLISESAVAASGLDFGGAEHRRLVLKGRAEPMGVVVERPGARSSVAPTMHPRV
jgi:adenylate cyclase